MSAHGLEQPKPDERLGGGILFKFDGQACPPLEQENPTADSSTSFQLIQMSKQRASCAGCSKTDFELNPFQGQIPFLHVVHQSTPQKVFYLSIGHHPAPGELQPHQR